MSANMLRRAGLQVLRHSFRGVRQSAGTVTSQSALSDGAAGALAKGFATFLKNADISLSPGLSVGAVRQFAKAAKQDGLERALNAEIKDQEEQYEPSNEKPPNGFKVVETPGSRKLQLRKTHGTEEVEIVLFIDPEMDAAYAEDAAYDQDGAEGEEGAEDEEYTPPPSPVHFMVTVTKGDDDRTLAFDCTYSGDSFDLDMVQMTESTVPNTDAYGGPNYLDLDDNLQESFRKYLSDRGVDETLMRSLAHLREDKEEREYGRWLKEVKSFVTK